MFIRKLQRELTCLALATCAPLVFGCATTGNYLVDPASASREAVASVAARGDRTVEFEQPPPNGLKTDFPGQGGAIDTTTMTVRGTSPAGAMAEVPLGEIGGLKILAKSGGAELVEVRADALLAGRSWRPDGEVQTIFLQSGEVIDARNSDGVVDARRGVVLLAAAGQDTTDVPFGEIRYLRIKDSHPGRTALCVLGVSSLVLIVYATIAMWGSDFSWD